MYLSHPRAIKAVSAMEPTTCLSSRRSLCCEVGNLCFCSSFSSSLKWRFRKRRMIFWNIIKYCCDVNRRNMKDDGERGRSRSSRSGFVTKGEQEEKLHAHRKCCSHDRTRGEENRLDFKRDFLFAQFPAKFSSCPRKLRKARGSWISFVTL